MVVSFYLKCIIGCTIIKINFLIEGNIHKYLEKGDVYGKTY